MNQTIIQPAAMKMTPPSMAAMSAPAADIISPNEAKFWADWAEKAPGLIRDAVANQERRAVSVWPLVGLGAALGIASFSKNLSKTLRWTTGISSAASLTFGVMVALAQSDRKQMKENWLEIADEMEKNPRLREDFANALSSNITAEMASNGIDDEMIKQFLFSAPMAKILFDVWPVVRTGIKEQRDAGMSR